MSILRPLAKGGAQGLATLLVEKLSALLLVVGLARALSPDDYGRYSFIIAYLTLFQVLADIGLEPTLLRRLSQNREDRFRLLANALGLRVGLALLSATLAVILTPLAAPDNPSLRWPVAVGAAGLLFMGQPGFRAWFRSELRIDLVLRVATMTNVLLFLGVGLAVGSGAGLTGLFAGIASAHLLGWLYAGWSVRSRVPLRIACEVPVWRSLITEAWPVGANTFVIMLSLRIAPVLLMRYEGPIEVGYYASAMRLAEALNLVADGLMMVVFPVFSRLAMEKGEALRALSSACAKLLGTILLCVALALSQLAPDVLVLLFGEKFRAAGPTLAVLGAFAVLASVGTVYSMLLVALGRQRSMLGVNAVFALLQIGLQFLFISKFGLLGAATGLVAGAAATQMALYLWPATGEWIRPCARPVVGLVVVAASVLALSGLLPGDAFAKGVGLVTLFLAASVGLGLLGRRDIEGLRLALQTD